MPIVLFSNLKGGVAKTTTAVAISECFADQGLRTLLIDADHQCSASEMLLGEGRLVKADQKNRTLHDLLARMLGDDSSRAKSTITSCPGRRTSATGSGKRVGATV